MNREFSDSLMVHYDNRTQSIVPQSTRMPAITFNGVSIYELNKNNIIIFVTFIHRFLFTFQKYNETEQDYAKYDLANIMCNHLNPKPAENIC